MNEFGFQYREVDWMEVGYEDLHLDGIKNWEVHLDDANLGRLESLHARMTKASLEFFSGEVH